jgi:diguanylate cyclase (GGDEF)-like protein
MRSRQKSASRTPAGAQKRRATDSTRPDPKQRRIAVDELNTQAHEVKRLDYDKLRELGEQAFELACQTDADGEQYTYGMAAALSLLAYRNSSIGEWDAAMSEASQALALLEPGLPTPVLAEVLQSIGWTHYCMGEFTEALENLMSAVRIAEEIGDTSLQAYMLDTIGAVQASANHSDAAIECQQRALQIHRELGDATGEALVLNNMAYTYAELGDFERALSAAMAALDFASKEHRDYFLVAVLDTVAYVHYRMGKLDDAESYAERSLALAQQLGSEPDEATSLMGLGKIAIARASWDEALELVCRALELSEKRDLSMERFKCHELLSRIHEQQGEFAEALKHFKEFHELKQAGLNEETQARLANLRVSYQLESAKKDAEIHRLRSLALEREVEERKVAQARLEAQASLDALTGLFNRGHLVVLAEEMRVALSHGRAVSLMMFDIDRFKQVNDTFGHLAGDRVLVAITKELTDHCRDTDVPCRYGGDEFLVLLIGMDIGATRKAAERLRERIAATPVPYGDLMIGVTISAGVSTARAGEDATLDDLIERADRALYAAKQGGRDRVVVMRTP